MGKSTTRDVATNSTSSGTPSGVYLYFREDQSISRTRCPDGGVGIYDRAHCTTNKQSVPAKAFIDGISIGVGTTIDQHAQNVRDLFAQVKKIQDQLLQLMASAPGIQTQIDALRSQITSAEANIAALQVQVEAMDQQIGAIKAQLAVQNNVDLNVQLGKLLDERSKLVTQQNQAQADEQAKREQFIAANSSTLDQETFRDVQAQEQVYVKQLDDEKGKLTSAMQEVSDLNKTIAHINDSGFTFNVIEGQAAFSGLKPFTRRFQDVFETLVAANFAPAPDFTPTNFDLHQDTAITFAQPLPAWATNVKIELDGVTTIVPAAAKVTLSLNTNTEGSHAIRLVLVGSHGELSKPSSVQNLIVKLAFAHNIVTGAGGIQGWYINGAQDGGGRIGYVTFNVDRPGLSPGDLAYFLVEDGRECQLPQAMTREFGEIRQRAAEWSVGLYFGGCSVFGLDKFNSWDTRCKSYFCGNIEIRIKSSPGERLPAPLRIVHYD